MNKQLNFFAAPNDMEWINSRLFETFGSLIAFPARAQKENFQATPISTLSELERLNFQKLLFFCRLSDKDFVKFIETESIVTIDFNNSPVFEYSPSQEIEPGVLKIGRVFSTCLQEGFEQSVHQFLSSLRKKAHRIETSDFWIFPFAARTAKRLQPWLGKDIKNPML